MCLKMLIEHELHVHYLAVLLVGLIVVSIVGVENPDLMTLLILYNGAHHLRHHLVELFVNGAKLEAAHEVVGLTHYSDSVAHGLVHFGRQRLLEDVNDGLDELGEDTRLVLSDLLDCLDFLRVCCALLQVAPESSHSLFLLALHLERLNGHAIVPYLAATLALVPEVDEVAGAAGAHIQRVLKVIKPQLTCAHAAHIHLWRTLLLFWLARVARLAIIAIVRRCLVGADAVQIHA